VSRFDVVALARAIRLRREARIREGWPVPITPAMSRILERDLEYVPYRQRKEDRARKYAACNPAIGTVMEIADLLDTTVGALLGERAYRIGTMERRTIRSVLLYLVEVLDLDAPEVRGFQRPLSEGNVLKTVTCDEFGQRAAAATIPAAHGT